ncbi:SMI1 / KNR4 family protein [Rubripirellula tenax]|uniref:SMI1 / KNR4 family protein n=1 Tax=Rubripirellula tenax TaxID=2528015 RepID=A0A5C6EN83_9BACT|nr:SMI1/KNR4 family protein [Rubripirellula tenax]TWU49036.1 SMI1 / KNR4 family protein [Rubripirellula tenax]
MSEPILYVLQPDYNEHDTLSFVVSYLVDREPVYPPSAIAFQDCFDRKPLSEGWIPPSVIIERDEQRTDIYEIESCFAVNQKAKHALSPLIGEHVEFLPVGVVGERGVDSGGEDYKPIAEPQELYLLNPLVEVELGKGSISHKMAYRYVTKYVFDPKDLYSVPIFRAKEDLCILASDSFRQLVKSKGLRGLALEDEFEWHASAAGVAAATSTTPKKKPPKQVDPPELIPEDELSGVKQMTTSWWESVQDHWCWACDATRARDGNVDQKPKVYKPINERQLATLRRKVGGRLPSEFEHVLTHYARKVSFSWDLMESPLSDDFPDELRECCGCFADLWDVATLPEFAVVAAKNCQSEMPYFHEAFNQRLPFIETGNGDYIAFDMRNGTEECPIVYLSHENDESHNRVLGQNFVEFLLRWSGVGCVGPDFPYLEAFYDARKKRVHCHGRNAKKWRDLMASGV